MPEDPKPAGAKPGAKGKGAGLKRKLGPLPLWAWLAIVGGAVAAWYFLLRDGGGGESGGPVEVVTGSRAATPQETAYAGGASSNGALAGQIDPTSLQAIQDQLGSQVGDIRGHVTELEDAFSRAGFTVNEDKTWTGPEMANGGGVEDLDAFVRGIVSSMGGVQGAPGARQPAGKPPKTTKPPKTKPKPKPPRGSKPPKTKPKPPRRDIPPKGPIKGKPPKATIKPGKVPTKRPSSRQPAPTRRTRDRLRAGRM